MADEHPLTADDRGAFERLVNEMSLEELARIGTRVLDELDEARRFGPRYALMLSSQGEWWALRHQAGLMPEVPEAVKMTGCRVLTNLEAGRVHYEGGGVLFDLEYQEPAEAFFDALERGVEFQIQLGWL